MLRKYIPYIILVVLLMSGCTSAAEPIAASPISGSASTAPVSTEKPVPTEPLEEPELANPASIYCEQQGGNLEIQTAADGSQSGVCLFQDGSQCDEWAFYRGECAPGQGMEDSNPQTSPGYVNETYGFSLNLLPGWTIEEHPDYLVLNRPGYKVFIGYQWANEDPKPFRTGMPSGEFIDGGVASLLGQEVSKQILDFEGKNKVVAYNGRIKAGDLILVIYLDPVGSADDSYQDLDIPTEIISEADQIIASFAFINGEEPEIEFNP